jgi:hypothetical protein
MSGSRRQPQSIAILIHRMHGPLQTLIVPIGPDRESGSEADLAARVADIRFHPASGIVCIHGVSPLTASC